MATARRGCGSTPNPFCRRGLRRQRFLCPYLRGYTRNCSWEQRKGRFRCSLSLLPSPPLSSPLLPSPPLSCSAYAQNTQTNTHTLVKCCMYFRPLGSHMPPNLLNKPSSSLPPPHTNTHTQSRKQFQTSQSTASVLYTDKILSTTRDFCLRRFESFC